MTHFPDPVNQKKHFAVTDSGGKVVGTALGFTDLDAKGAMSVWAKCLAPPAGVDTIPVVIAKDPAVRGRAAEVGVDDSRCG